MNGLADAGFGLRRAGDEDLAFFRKTWIDRSFDECLYGRAEWPEDIRGRGLALTREAERATTIDLRRRTIKTLWKLYVMNWDSHPVTGAWIVFDLEQPDSYAGWICKGRFYLKGIYRNLGLEEQLQELSGSKMPPESLLQAPVSASALL